MAKMIKKKKTDIMDFMYLIGFSLLLIRAFIYTTAFDQIFPLTLARIMRPVAYIIILYRFVKIRKVRISTFLIASVMIILSFVVGLGSTYTVVIDYAVCSVCAINIKFDKIVKTYTYVSIAMTILTIAASLLNIIENYVYIRNGAIRLSLGFVYPTDFVAHIFFIVCGICYLTFTRIKLWHGFVYGLLAYVMYLLTNSRGPSMMIIIVYVLCLWSRYRLEKRKKPFPHWLLKFSSVICAILTFAFIEGYNPNNKYWALLDKFASRRLSIGKRLLSDYGVTLLGQYVKQKGDGHGIVARGVQYTYIDLSFMRLLVLYGILFFIFILFYSTVLCKKNLKEGNYAIPVLMMAISFYSLTAQHYLDFAYNFVLLAYFAVAPHQYDVKRKRIKLII